MAKCETSEKKPKRRSRVGLVLLIILGLLLGTVGFLCYSVIKAPIALDDPQKMAASEPMAPAERFRFSSADQTAQIKVNAADIWNFILTNAGTDFLDLVNQELSAYSLSVSGCGIHIDEKGAQLNLELYYENIRLAAKIPLALEISGQHVCLKPTGVKLGVIPLPVEDMLSSVKLEADFQLPVISDVTGVSYEKDGILITGTIKEDLQSLISPDGVFYRFAVFSEEKQPLTDAVITEAGHAALLAHLEKNPGDIEALYRELFILAGSETTKEYLDSRMDLTQRIFPEMDFSVMEAERTEAIEEVMPLVTILERFFASVLSDYNGDDFQLSDGEFLKKLQPFHATKYGGGNYEAMFDVLNPDDFFLVLVDTEDGYTDKTPALNQLADENQQFTQPVDFNKIYIMGCVFRSLDGEPFLMYETKAQGGNRDITLRPLTEDDVSALQVSGKFGVWTD